MNESENLILQGLQLTLERLALEVCKQRSEAEARGEYGALPVWLDLEQAIALKRGLCEIKKRAPNGKTRSEGDPIMGGASLTFYRQHTFLQPCCGFNHKMVGGRRCWKKEDVIEWLAITDEGLTGYAAKYHVILPETYQRRGKKIA
jgi:hypothetical protein